ncbi:MAG: NAD(+) synthase, partial [Tannerellaceae bacterium]|nr:NAD(+) synthase [Tannerellaceae bacterium]
MDHGFIKVAAATPLVRVADCTYNTDQMEHMMRNASEQGVQIIAFPELAVTAYTCLDLFTTHTLPDEAERALLALIRKTKDLNMLTFTGVPLRMGDVLINACVVFQSGNILGVVPKTYLPNYGESQEKRRFTSAREIKDDTIMIGNAKYPVSPYLLFSCETVKIGAEIGEELRMPAPPSAFLAMAGAHIIINPSASSELAGKHARRKQAAIRQSACCIAGYIHAACGYGESTTDMVFAGGSLIAENGKILAEADRFSMEGTLTVSEIDIDSLKHDRRLNTCFTEGLADFNDKRAIPIPFVLAKPHKGFELTRRIDPYPFIPADNLLDERCEEIIGIQVAGLAKRLEHTRSKTAVIGISGGLDSTLSLLVTAMTFDALNISRKQITGVTMPGFGTTGRTYGNATALMESLGITSREISIKEATLLHFKDIGHNPDNHDVTYENAQARERTQLLMDIANQESGIVIGTGDLSELALGWTTYNGDHISMYGVNAGIPKTLVKCL